MAARRLAWSLGIAALALLAFAVHAEASHYSGATLHWEPVGGTDVRFHATMAWSASEFGVIPAHVGQTLDVYSKFQLQFGDGTSLTGTGPQWQMRILNVDMDTNHFTALLVDQNGDPGLLHRYAPSGVGVTAYEASLYVWPRRPASHGHVNNPDTMGKVTTTVNVDVTGPVGKELRTPAIQHPGVIECHFNRLCQYEFNAIFPDVQYPFAYRLSKGAEMGPDHFVQPGLPHATHAATITPSGLLEWDTKGAKAGNSGTFYSIHLMLEGVDHDVHTSIEVLIHLTAAKEPPPPPINVYLVAPTPCTQTFETVAGYPMQVSLAAETDTEGHLAFLGPNAVPGGGVMTNHVPGETGTANIEWSSLGPGTHNIGVQASTPGDDKRRGGTDSCGFTIIARDLLASWDHRSEAATDGLNITFQDTVAWQDWGNPTWKWTHEDYTSYDPNPTWFLPYGTHTICLEISATFQEMLDSHVECHNVSVVRPTIDQDNDGYADERDNCPAVRNRSQSDRDNDGIGDACDTDESDEQNSTGAKQSESGSNMVGYDNTQPLTYNQDTCDDADSKLVATGDMECGAQRDDSGSRFGARSLVNGDETNISTQGRGFNPLLLLVGAGLGALGVTLMVLRVRGDS